MTVAARTSPAAQPTDDLRAKILAAFPPRVEPVPVGLAYRAGLALVATAMVILPLLYLALLAATAYGVFLLAVDGPSWFPNVRNRWVAYLWIGSILMGIILVFFMIKPLFARQPPKLPPRSLDPRLEPLLFDFVHRICRLVDAPIPQRIDVDLQSNASASFDDGWSSVARRRLVLTLGLPLVQGLTVEQLAGVIAHELGHFAQGAGMRVTYLIRSVNAWFARVVYERDNWDRQLAEAAEKYSEHHVALAYLLYGSQGMVWLVRRILYGLMMMGHGISCFMMRQMEFDADRYEARMVGADVFESTCRQLGALNLAHQQALGDLGALWQEGRLVDDLSGLVASARADLPKEAEEWLEEMTREQTTGFLDTHPADRDRIASARRERVEAPFACDLPATALFRDFAELSRRLSRDFYELRIGRRPRPEELVDSQAAREARRAEQAELETIPRMIGIACDHERPLPVDAPAAEGPPDVGRVAGRLEELRQRILDQMQERARLCERFDQVVGDELEALVASDLVDCGVRLDPQQFSFAKSAKPSVESVVRRLEAQNQRIDQLADALSQPEEESAERIRLALSLLDVESLVSKNSEELAGWRDERDRLFSTLQAYRGERERLRGLGRTYVRYVQIGSRLQEEPEKLQKLFLGLAEDLQIELAHLFDAWATVPYPFDHAREDTTLADFCIVTHPSQISEDYGHLHDVAQETLQRCAQLHARVLGRLCAMAERMESELGFEPLEMPELEPQEDEQAARD